MVLGAVIQRWRWMLRCDQPNRVSKRLELASPVVGATTGFHPDRPGRKMRDECCDLLTPQLLTQHSLPALVRPVNLKYVLGPADANCRNAIVTPLPI
jgi:hypothetical protein